MESKYNIAVYDIETGGFLKSKHGICDISIDIISPDLEVIAQYDQIVAPYSNSENMPYEYTQGAFDVNGMNMEMIKTQGKEAKIVFKEVFDFLNQYSVGKGVGKQKPILCGQNIVKFDTPFLEEHMLLFKKDLWKVVEKNFCIDTMWWGRMRHRASVDYKLPTLCKNEDIIHEDAHRARPDVNSTTKLVIEYMKFLRGVGVVNKNEKPANFKDTKRFRDNFEI